MQKEYWKIEVEVRCWIPQHDEHYLYPTRKQGGVRLLIIKVMTNNSGINTANIIRRVNEVTDCTLPRLRVGLRCGSDIRIYHKQLRQSWD